jgi:hypothetical protein
MDIEDAFTPEAIQAAGTNVEGAEEEELRQLITRVFVDNEINWSDEQVSVAVLTFVAGRTYQSDQVDMNNFPIVMNVAMVQEFLEFLVAKGAT